MLHGDVRRSGVETRKFHKLRLGEQHEQFTLGEGLQQIVRHLLIAHAVVGVVHISVGIETELQLELADVVGLPFVAHGGDHLIGVPVLVEHDDGVATRKRADAYGQRDYEDQQNCDSFFHIHSEKV